MLGFFSGTGDKAAAAELEVLNNKMPDARPKELVGEPIGISNQQYRREGDAGVDARRAQRLRGLKTSAVGRAIGLKRAPNILVISSDCDVNPYLAAFGPKGAEKVDVSNNVRATGLDYQNGCMARTEDSKQGSCEPQLALYRLVWVRNTTQVDAFAIKASVAPPCER